MVGQRCDEERQLVGWRRHVGIGEDDQIGLGEKHAGPHRGTLPAMGDRDDAEADHHATGRPPRAAQRRWPLFRRCSRHR